MHEISLCAGSVIAQLQPSRQASHLEKWDSLSPTFASSLRQEGSFRQLWKLQQLLNRGPSKDQYWKVLFLDLGNQNKAWIEQMHFWIKLLHSIFHWAKEMVLLTMGAEETRMKAATQPSGIIRWNHILLQLLLGYTCITESATTVLILLIKSRYNLVTTERKLQHFLKRYFF